LEAATGAHALFQQIKPLTLWGSRRSLFLRLWEDKRQLVNWCAEEV
jgi:hypothetical protein